MQISFENLEKISDIVKDIELIKKHLLEDTSNTKRWLSTKELSEYLPYSKETINKKVQNETFICGTHFFQKDKIRMFDKFKIDEWVMNEELSSRKKALKNAILKDFQLDI